MSLYERLTVDFEHADDRGKLVQLLHDGYKQVNVLRTNKGVTRGGHYHKICREAFFIISGSVEVSFKNRDQLECVTFQADDFFRIDPYVVHSMFFLEDCVMVQMYDVPVEQQDGTKDIYVE
jgi:mannose-6-phosphate isomerase-like protein (cupin superfamily)